jgi:hypothetical protein
MENDIMKKMTKREKFTILLCHLQDDFAPDTKIEGVPVEELIEFIDHELELLAKKNVSSTGEKKLTATQKANEGLKSDIYAHMAENPTRLFTIAELIKEVPACAELSTSKVTAMLTQLIKAKQVERISDKRKSYFKVLSA